MKRNETSGCILLSIALLNIHICRFTNFRYKYYFCLDRLIIKTLLLEDECNFLSVYWLPLDGYS